MLPTSKFWTLAHLQDQNLCFVSPAAASCNGTNTPTPKRAPLSLQHLVAAPCSGTSRPAPERTRHSNSCTLQQQHAAAPFTSTLAARVGYIMYRPCSSTSRLAWQHPQAAPSTGIRSPACPLQKHGLKHARHSDARHSDSSPLKHHPQAEPAAAPWAPPACPLQTVHTILTASSTLHQHLAAALQGHQHARSKAHTPLWQQHAQRQQHASSKALHVWYHYQHVNHFGVKCG